MSEIRNIGIQCLKDEAQAILDMIPRMDSNFDEAVRMIYECEGKVIVTGVGKSGHIGSKIAATMASLGTPSFYLNPLDAYHGDLGMIDPRDIIIAISYSGQTDELLRLIPLIVERNVPVIGISGNPKSLLAKYSKVHLDIAVTHEADPLNLAPTSSTTATLAMGDAIACALVRLRHFEASDFARFHPGGTLGKRLLGRVRDYMATDQLSTWIVSPEDKLSDVIIKISEGKKGLVVALDVNEAVCGIITDGDMRRAVQKYRQDLFSLKVSDVMSNKPKQIHDDAMIHDAADMMQNNSIHALVVVDSENKFCGIIDYFACQ